MSDVYTTTQDPLRPMVCSSCGGHFAGDSQNIVKQIDPKVILCTHCLKERREFPIG